MNLHDAARTLGLGAGADWSAVRAAYRDRMREHHPDRPGVVSGAAAAQINEAYRVLRVAHAAGALDGAGISTDPVADDSGSAPASDPWERPLPTDPAVAIRRAADGDLWLGAPADETFLRVFEASHDIGEVTYVDRSMPILEVLCRFEGEPATSLLVSFQGRGEGTEVFCTVESIEARPAPPTGAVVDLLELALHRRSAS